MSLAELLVAASLFSFLLAGLAKVLTEGLTFFTVESIALETQQQAMVAMKWLEADMQGAHRESFSSYPDGLIFGSMEDRDGKIRIENGFLAWQKFLCYYIAPEEHTTVLIRKQRPLDPPSFAPPPIPPSLVPQSFKDDETQARVLARHIESLTASTENPTKINLLANYGHGSFTMTIQTEIALDEESRS